MDKKEPSLYDLAVWTNQYYEGNNLNIRQIIDGDILQVFNSIHLSGLLVQMGMGGEIVTLPETDEDEDHKEEGDDEDNLTEDEDDQEEDDDEEEGDSSGGPNSL